MSPKPYHYASRDSSHSDRELLVRRRPTGPIWLPTAAGYDTSRRPYGRFWYDKKCFTGVHRVTLKEQEIEEKVQEMLQIAQWEGSKSGRKHGRVTWPSAHGLAGTQNGCEPRKHAGRRDADIDRAPGQESASWGEMQEQRWTNTIGSPSVCAAARKDEKWCGRHQWVSQPGVLWVPKWDDLNFSRFSKISQIFDFYRILGGLSAQMCFKICWFCWKIAWIYLETQNFNKKQRKKWKIAGKSRELSSKTNFEWRLR